MTSDASHAMVDHPDHQDAIVFEKLKLLKISFSKPEKKQAVVVVLNTDAWLSGSVVGVFGGLCFFSESWRFWFTLPALLSLAVIESCRSTSATTRFKLASSTAFQNFNAHFAQTLEEELGVLETGSEVPDLQVKRLSNVLIFCRLFVL